jgi:hypothetical protein
MIVDALDRTIARGGCVSASSDYIQSASITVVSNLNMRKHLLRDES